MGCDCAEVRAVRNPLEGLSIPSGGRSHTDAATDAICRLSMRSEEGRDRTNNASYRSIPAMAPLPQASLHLGSSDGQFAAKHPMLVGKRRIVDWCADRSAQNVSLAHQRLNESVQVLVRHCHDVREPLHRPHE
jgi:hypothetical protein